MQLGGSVAAAEDDEALTMRSDRLLWFKVSS